MIRKQRKLRFLHIALAMPILLALASWFTLARITGNARNRLDREVKALKRLGIFETAETLQPPVDINNNAAGDYRNAIADLVAHGRRPPTEKGDQKGPAFIDSIEFRAWVRANQAALVHTSRAAEKPYCNFNRPWGKGVFVLFPELADMKTLAKLVTAKAHYAASERGFSGAFQWFETGRRVARHAGEPHFVGQLVQIACESIVLRQVQEEIVLHGGNSIFRAQARAFLVQPGDLPSLRNGLKGEALFIALSMKLMANDKLSPQSFIQMMPGDEGESVPVWITRIPGVTDDAEAKILAAFRMTAEKLGDDPNDHRAVLEAGSAFDSESLVDDGSVSGKLAAIFYPLVKQVASAIVKLEANRRLARCGLELYEIRSKNGSFPSTLPNEKWATDPFTEQPFAYKPSTRGFILYSVGPNLKDEGGKPHYQKTNPISDDVEFFAPRP